ncbi:hypothetical protein [Dyadobacter sediminis]|uniref:Uncharacterized protein n=1 Tax=Dyadobacter sediminis TaxID=1493691 RepID=A0A5R9K6P0_9BACT|nr:hypothetical protein [Dyadobacter sediminis]TLU89442.1 hypothetical protein FEM55_22130 [Dyadobacter sediminis]GGC05378.1 hypothetical protein GCM10011325_35340 [Dyadobacter sediminis]
MKLPEEEADKELRKKLQAKFENFNAPVKDQVRANVFAALDKSDKKLYWTFAGAALFLIVAFLAGGRYWNQKGYDKVPFPVSGQNRTVHDQNRQPDPALKKGENAGKETERRSFEIQAVPKGISGKLKKKPVLQKQRPEKALDRISSRNRLLTSSKSSSFSEPEVFSRYKMKDFTAVRTKEPNTEMDNKPVTGPIEQPTDLTFLSPVDSVKLGITSETFTLPPIFENTNRKASKKPGILYGVHGVFSAAVLQTFQLVSLNNSASDRVQNFQFAPLLSSRSLSYKLTAGLEKKRTQLLLSYQYFRNWNEYEIGTNQVIATRIGEHQYSMLRIGEKQVEDDRSHLLGIGLRQRFVLPQHILKNYSVSLGMDYARMITGKQNLLWGNLGFYKQVCQSGKSRFEIGPYFQYSFVERKVAGQTWKFRPYQIGISVNVRIK